MHKKLIDELKDLRGRELVEGLFAFMEHYGHQHYDEVVTQLEHALQCAQLASQRELGASAITSALLHDLGHLLVDQRDGEQNLLAQGEHHGTIGAEVLSVWFPPEVTEPIRLHVVAKRYLCAVDSGYFDGLSPASQRSLLWQGGKLSAEEVESFEAHPSLEIAVEIRRIDDLGKHPEQVTPPLGSFVTTVASSLRADCV